MPANIEAATSAQNANPATRPRKRRPRYTFYTSPQLSASSERAGAVHIDLKASTAAGRAAFLEAAANAARGAAATATSDRIDYTTALEKALHAAFVSLLETRFEQELGRVVSGYRRMLLEDVVTGDDPDLKTALNRARLQARVLGSTPMVDQAQACELMGLSPSNPSATMKRKAERGEVLRFVVDGRVLYPLFQFDVDRRGLAPGLARLMAEKPAGWSDFRLLHWLTRPHIDFDGAPSTKLASDPEAVVSAYRREIAPVEHG